MVDFLLLTSFSIFLTEIISFSSIIIDQIIFFKNFYLVLFVFFFSINYFVINRDEKFNFNIDLLVRYFLFFLKTPSIFLNFIFNVIKQIYLFTFHFKYKFKMDANKMIYRNVLSTLSLIWRPLFKKFSYFGYFRSNRSKWIK